MTPVEHAVHWAKVVRKGDSFWVKEVVPSLADEIAHAVIDERERCAKKARSFIGGDVIAETFCL